MFERGHGAEVLPAEVADVVRRAARMLGDCTCDAPDCAAIALRRLAATLGGK